MQTFDDAAGAFRGFFAELREGFLERESLFTQIELALLCREHVLVTGPPGTAKSAIASAVLGRILDETTGRPSLFAKQISELTVQTDLIGQVDFKVLTETGRTEYLTDDGMLGATHAFLDEVFDGRDMLLRSILNVLHERELKHGRRVTPGKTESVIMTSNRYLSEVLARSPELLLAFADRLSFICFVPKAFARPQSRAAVLGRAMRQQRMEWRAQLSLQTLDVLQRAVEEVTIPPALIEALEGLAERLERELYKQVARLPDYVPTKYFSHRSIVKALWALKAAVVRDRIWRHPERPLQARSEDLEALRHFFLLGGPTLHDTELLLKSSVDPREKAQLEILRLEHKAFDEVLATVQGESEGGVAKEAASLAAREELGLAEAQLRSWRPADVISLVASLRRKLVPGPRHPENREALLAVCRVLLTAAQARLSRGMAGQGEGRGGVQLHVSLRAVLELARELPELSASVPELCAHARTFGSQALEMIALAAEGAAFEGQATLEQLAGMAVNLHEEVEGLHELLSFVGVALPDQGAALAKEEASLRGRAAGALRTRLDALVPSLREEKAGSAEEALAVASRKLGEVEVALVALSPSQKGLRQALLAPLAREWAQDVLGRTQFTRAEEYAHAIRALAERLRQEGLPAEAVLRGCSDLLEQRLAHHVAGLGNLPRTAAPDPEGALSGDAYVRYRQAFAQTAQEGELRGLEAVEKAASAPTASGVQVTLGEGLKAAAAGAELEALQARVDFLVEWMGHLVKSLPDPNALQSRPQAERCFDQLVKSRFPVLVMKEGELLRMSAALGALASLSGDTGQRAQALDVKVRALSDQFAHFARALVEARGRL